MVQWQAKGTCAATAVLRVIRKASERRERMRARTHSEWHVAQAALSWMLIGRLFSDRTGTWAFAALPPWFGR